MALGQPLAPPAGCASGVWGRIGRKHGRSACRSARAGRGAVGVASELGNGGESSADGRRTAGIASQFAAGSAVWHGTVDETDGGGAAAGEYVTTARAARKGTRPE